MNLERNMLKVALISLFCCFTLSLNGCAEAQAPCPEVDPNRNIYATEVIEDSVIAFEVSDSKEFPIDVVLYKTMGACRKSIIDRYEWAGAVPTVEAVFPYSVHGEMNLFVIVSWQIDHRGLGIYGTSYQIHAYEKGSEGWLESNQTIRDANEMTGIEGVDNYEEVHFYGKNPEEVKQLIDNLGLN